MTFIVEYSLIASCFFFLLFYPVQTEKYNVVVWALVHYEFFLVFSESYDFVKKTNVRALSLIAILSVLIQIV